jgi:hypothetical protein
MALSKNIRYKGLEINETYIKVLKFEGDKENLYFTIGYFIDKDEDSLQVKTFNFKYIIDGSNPVAQAYEYLKTLEEYSDAKDC